MANGIGGNLAGLLQPFNEQSEIARIAAIVQMAQQNPEALAAMLAKTGAQPPPIPSPAAASPFAGGGGGGTVGGQGGDVLRPAPPLLGGSAGDLGAPNAPISAPAPLPAAPELGGGDGRLEGLLKAVSQLEAPAAPPLPRTPAAQLPRAGGPAPDPGLLALLAKLLQGAPPPAGPVPLGQLIAGRAAPTAAPTVQF